MPHFIIECSSHVIHQMEVQQLNKLVHSIAADSGLFDIQNIKVRTKSYDEYLIAGSSEGDFLHIFAHIMGGRTEDQKAALSEEMVKTLKNSFADLEVISMNVYEFDPKTYRNKNQV